MLYPALRLYLPVVLGAAGLIVSAVLARHDDWLGAATMTGTTGLLLVSPISWTHHWVWILPALVILLQAGPRSRVAAACAYVLFVAAPMWFTPHDGGSGEYGLHWLLTLAANCYLIAGLAFLGCMARRAYLIHWRGAAALPAANSAAPAMTPRVTAKAPCRLASPFRGRLADRPAPDWRAGAARPARTWPRTAAG
jgi:hypothetical protein